MPPVDAGRALVVFMWPPCESFNDPDDESLEALFMCTHYGRIRVVELGGRFVTEMSHGQYSASYETAGKHLYCARHLQDACGSPDCVAAEAELAPGRLYFVALRWTARRQAFDRPSGRLEFLPIPPAAEGWYRRWLVSLDRVESNPEYEKYSGLFVGLRDVDVSSVIMRRIQTDAKLGISTPRIR